MWITHKFPQSVFVLFSSSLSAYRLLVLLRCFSIFEPGLRDAERSSLQRKSHERDYRADGSKRMYIVTFREAYSRVCVSRNVVIAFHRCFTSRCHIVANCRPPRVIRRVTCTCAARELRICRYFNECVSRCVSRRNSTRALSAN